MTAAAAGLTTGRPAVADIGAARPTPGRTAAGASVCSVASDGAADGTGAARGRSSGVTAAASRWIAAMNARIGRGTRGSCCHVAAAVHGSARSRQPET